MADQLPSWHDGPAKARILEFLRSVTEPGAGFVPAGERVAAFGNDGTLWCEKPMYPRADFLVRRWADQVKADPAKAEEQPWKAVAEGDRAWLAAALDHVPDLIRGVTEAYEGITAGEFETAVRRFFGSARHPALSVPYTAIAYRPMGELIQFLEASGFGVYLCSAGGRDFVRAGVAGDVRHSAGAGDRLGHDAGVPPGNSLRGRRAGADGAAGSPRVSCDGQADGRGLQPGLRVLLLPVQGDAVPGVQVPDGRRSAGDLPAPAAGSAREGPGPRPHQRAESPELTPRQGRIACCLRG